MSIDQAALVQMIYDSVFSKMVQPAQSSKKQETLLALEFPGQQLDESQYQNPWSPDNPEGAQFATEMFSELIDAIPLVSPTYADSGVTVEEMYDFILGASALPLPGASESVNPINRLLSRAQSLFDQTTMARAFHPAITYHPSYATPFNWADSDSAQNWTTINIDTNSVKTKTDSPFLKLKKTSRLHEGIWEIAPDHLSQLDQIRTKVLKSPLKSVKTSVTSPTKGSVRQPTLSGNVSSRVSLGDTQRQVIDPQSLRAVRSLSLSPTDQIHSSRAEELADAVARFHNTRVRPEGLRPHRPVLKPTPIIVKPIDKETRDIKISFRCCRVSFKRPWLMKSLLSLQGWTLPGQRPGSFSNGSLEDNEGVFPVMPTGFLAIRDLKIKARWSEADRAIANQAVSSRSAVGFGPFALSGHTAESGKSYQASFDGITISSPGLQILGWINVATPFMPPEPV